MEIAILAIDIESTGPHIINNEIISIGYCLGTLDGKTITKKRINFKLDNSKKFDTNCQIFWNDHLDKLVILSINTKEPIDAIQEFQTDVDLMYKKYNLKIITDNPSFDLFFINYYLAKYLDRKPLNYNNDKYNPVYDTDSYSRGVEKKMYDCDLYDSELIKKYDIKLDAIHDHLPENDAEYIFKFHINLIKKITNKSK